MKHLVSASGRIAPDTDPALREPLGGGTSGLDPYPKMALRGSLREVFLRRTPTYGLYRGIKEQHEEYQSLNRKKHM